jgi:very-short-patch-repair endonuclease
MASDLPDYLDRLAQIQRGVLSASQARQYGVSVPWVRSRLRSGKWQQVHHGVYATFTGEPSRDALLWAAVLRAGPEALLSHYSAAELFGLVDVPTTPIHVTIPPSRRVLPVRGLSIHVGSRAARAAHPTAMPPRTRIEETVLDLTQLSASADDACGWVTRGIGRGLTTQDRLRDALGLRIRVRFRAELSELLSPELAGVHSPLEYRYVKWVEIPHGLPRGRRQARAVSAGGRIFRDVLYDEYHLTVELDGRAAHPGDTRWKDIRRDNAAVAAGLRTLRFGWHDLRSQPCLVADQVYRALRRSGPVLARPCSPGCPVTRNTDEMPERRPS